MVALDSTVMLIDCDSFQIGATSHGFSCDVGTPLFTPPELHGYPFRGLFRVTNHDCFGLAVLLFHLLFMGRHPFAGLYAGPAPMPIETAIAEYRFAYGPNRAANGMERPPGTIALEVMSPPVPELFVRAFAKAGAADRRPDARAWIAALEALQTTLTVCPAAHWHHYPRALSSCPWCAVEAQTGIRLFGFRIAGVGSTGTVDLAALWDAIISVPDPGADPALPSQRKWHKPAGVKLPIRHLKKARMVVSIAVGCIGLAACNELQKNGGGAVGLLFYGIAAALWPWVSSTRKAAADRACQVAQAEWQQMLNRWSGEASRAVFDEKRRALEAARAGLAELPNERRRRIAVLEAQREQNQRRRYLDRFRIDRAKIRGIGPGRAAMLASFGIETAVDIDEQKIIRIPGFGPTLTSEIIQWQHRHLQNFRFNPNEPVDPRDISALDRELDTKRKSMLATLQQGPQLLQQQHAQIAAARARLMPILEKAWSALKIAEAQKQAL